MQQGLLSEGHDVKSTCVNSGISSPNIFCPCLATERTLQRSYNQDSMMLESVHFLARRLPFRSSIVSQLVAMFYHTLFTAYL